MAQRAVANPKTSPKEVKKVKGTRSPSITAVVSLGNSIWKEPAPMQGKRGDLYIALSQQAEDTESFRLSKPKTTELIVLVTAAIGLLFVIDYKVIDKLQLVSRYRTGSWDSTDRPTGYMS
jgi:hypothetical protein